jgi:hypothetical protein
MSTSALSEAAAHQELILMDSRVADRIAESFFDRFSRRDMSHYDILARFGDLLAETRVGGGRVIHLGKIITNEILEFMEAEPDVPSGMQLEAAVRSLGELAPFLAPLLAPIAAEVDCQGFGRLVAETSFEQTLHRRARIFFKRFADLLNITRNLLAGADRMSLNVISFEEPAPFQLDTSEDPFDLDDLSTVSPTTKAAVKFLAKMAWSDAEFTDAEKQFLAQAIDRLDQSLSPSQWERLVAEASQEPLESILKILEPQPTTFKENLCLSAMLLAASDRRVAVIEKKILAQALPFLGISRQRYSEIAKDALSILKVRRPEATEEPIPPAGVQEPVSPPAGSVTRPTSAVPEAPQRVQGHQEAPNPAAHSVADRSTPVEPGIVHQHSGNSVREEVPTAAQDEAASHAPQPTPPSRDVKIWRCPACHMPQFHEFDECPQCGVIVSKFREKRARTERSEEPDAFIEVPADPEEGFQGPSGQQKTTEREVQPIPTCVACRMPIPPGAKYCPSCGVRNV